MRVWKARIRRTVGMGLVWGAAWFTAGLVLARVPGFFSDLPFALIFAPLGIACGLIFSGLLGVVNRGDGWQDLSVVRSVACGAVSGLLLSGVVVAGAIFRGAPVWPEFMLFGPPLAIGSAVTAAGSLAVARRRSLPARRDPGGSAG